MKVFKYINDEGIENVYILYNVDKDCFINEEYGHLTIGCATIVKLIVNIIHSNHEKEIKFDIHHKGYYNCFFNNFMKLYELFFKQEYYKDVILVLDTKNQVSSLTFGAYDELKKIS